MKLDWGWTVGTEELLTADDEIGYCAPDMFGFRFTIASPVGDVNSFDGNSKGVDCTDTDSRVTFCQFVNHVYLANLSVF